MKLSNKWKLVTCCRSSSTDFRTRRWMNVDGMNGMKIIKMNIEMKKKKWIYAGQIFCCLPECGAHNEFGLWRNNFCNHLFIHRVLFIAPLASAWQRDGTLLWLQASEASGPFLLLSPVLGHFLFQLCGQLGFCVFGLLLHFEMCV